MALLPVPLVVEMESRTPRIALFGPLCVCLEVIQAAQKADAQCVCVRLSPSEIIGVAARIAAID